MSQPTSHCRLAPDGASGTTWRGLVHGTPPNASQDRRRSAVQPHYAGASCRPTACEDGAPTPNAAYGPGGGFDCAPEAGGARVEPQYWFYRQAAELIVARGRVPGCI